MRQPSILDVIRAVKQVAATHGEVAAWWYIPPKRLRLVGELPGPAQEGPSVRVVIESRESVDADRVARSLSQALGGVTVRVRAHQGKQEKDRLFKLMSRAPALRHEV